MRRRELSTKRKNVLQYNFFDRRPRCMLRQTNSQLRQPHWPSAWRSRDERILIRDVAALDSPAPDHREQTEVHPDHCRKCIRIIAGRG